MDREELVLTGREVAEHIRDILSGKIEPFDADLHRWAADLSARMPNGATSDDRLVARIDDNLVNILSCDNASWDTSRHGFEESLGELDKALRGEDQ